jgi:hypothetical protein
MHPIRISTVFFSLVFFAGSAVAKCQPDIVTVTNADRSQLQSRAMVCDDGDDGSAKNSVSVYYISKPGADARLLDTFQLYADGEEPFGSLGLEDVDNDGFFEVELRGMCGAGPNCEGNLYKFDKKTKSLYHFFSGGYSHLLFIDGHLVEAGRASCCAWEFHAYKIQSGKKVIGEDTMAFMVDVRAAGDDSGEVNAVECEFKKQVRGEWKTIKPPNRKWLVICEHYGEAYSVVKPAGLAAQK